jgi:heme-degrading monooxygenase HmoA
MVTVIQLAKVKDYDKWEPIFKEDVSMIKASGAKFIGVLQSIDDPNIVIVTSEWEDLETAKKLAESDDIRARMEKSGVIKSEMYYMEQKLMF